MRALEQTFLKKSQNGFSSPILYLVISSTSGRAMATYWHNSRRDGSFLELNHQKIFVILLKHLPRANIINKTLDRINFPHEYFDVITVIGTIYYLPQPLRDLAHVRKLLKSNGISLIESPNFSNKGYIYRWKNHHFTKTWVYFYTPKSMEKIINLVGMEVVDRIDLPGHRASIGNFSGRIISWIELYITIIIRKISFGMIDIVPRFVLVAVRKNSQSKDGC